jgi:hypothetical protein
MRRSTFLADWRLLLLNLVESSTSSPWSASISVYLNEAKKLRLETSSFDRHWGSFTPVANVAGFLVFCRRRLKASAIFSASGISRWTEVQ